MHNTTTMNSENDNGQTMSENGHCFCIDNNEIIDLDDLPILGESLKANLGTTFHNTGDNPSFLVYVGF